MEVVKVLSKRVFKAGYEVRREIWKHANETQEMQAAYSTTDGSYIGTSRDAFFLCRTRGIAPQRRNRKLTVATIGFCARDGKWYGWSHRAIAGFKTKLQAVTFARSVS